MRTKIMTAVMVSTIGTCLAVSTIDPANKYAYGANIGWINFEQAHGQPKVNLLTGALSGVPDVVEYSADTDPFDDGDYLRITGFQTLETTNLVTWPLKTTRLYTLQHAPALTNTIPWTATSSSFIPPAGPDVTETVPGVADPNRFYRVQAEPPLSP